MPHGYGHEANPNPAAYGPMDLGLFPQYMELAQGIGANISKAMELKARRAAQKAEDDLAREKFDFEKALKNKTFEAEYGRYKDVLGFDGKKEMVLQPGLKMHKADVSEWNALDRAQRERDLIEIARGRLSETERHNISLEDVALATAAAKAQEKARKPAPGSITDKDRATAISRTLREEEVGGYAGFMSKKPEELQTVRDVVNHPKASSIAQRALADPNVSAGVKQAITRLLPYLVDR